MDVGDLVISVCADTKPFRDFTTYLRKRGSSQKYETGNLLESHN
jgi:hypothetical protein